jgi:hypothetical protein
MATVRVGSIVLRVDDLPRQRAFWTAALDYVPREDPDVDSIELRPRIGSGPNLTLDQHPAPHRLGRDRGALEQAPTDGGLCHPR